jgi:hypothetical protein
MIRIEYILLPLALANGIKASYKGTLVPNVRAKAPVSGVSPPLAKANGNFKMLPIHQI